MCLLVARTNICGTRRRKVLKIGVQRHFSKRPGELLLKLHEILPRVSVKILIRTFQAKFVFFMLLAVYMKYTDLCNEI